MSDAGAIDMIDLDRQSDEDEAKTDISLPGVKKGKMLTLIYFLCFTFK